MTTTSSLTAILRKTFASRTVITRFAITFVILGMVISSPIFMLVNPAQVSAATVNDNNSNRIDSSGYHSTPSVPAAAASPLSSPTPMVPAATTATNLGSNGDFTAQAALSGVWARQTNNIVGSQSYYDIVFVTSTTGTIKFIDITFPPGILIGDAPRLVEREGIGLGNAVKSSSNKISYTVISPISVPADTKIRLEFFNLVNPTVPSTGYKITVTTRDAAGTVIDGPTASNGFSMKQISTGQIADGAVTSGKIADGAVTTGKIADDAIQPQTISVESSRTVPPQTFGFLSAGCPATHPTVIGGGYDGSLVTSGGPFMHAFTDKSSSQAWDVSMYNSHPSSTFPFKVFAICMAPMP